MEESAEYYSWQVPDKPVNVRISAAAADRVLDDAMRGLGLLPRRGAEVGGLLLGAAGNDSRITVDGILPLPTEYAFGPSYILSEKDKQNLRAALRQCQAYVVGFYRTQTRDGLQLTPQDRELFSEYFPDPSSIVLLIRPRPLGVSVATLFFRNGSEVTAGPSLEFPAHPRPTPKLAEPEPPKPPPAPEHAAPTAEPAPRRRQPLWASWWIQLPILTCLLLLSGFMGFSAAAEEWPDAPERRAHPRNPYALSLLVVEHGNNLQLTWDHNAPALASASGAVLSITDGAETRSLDLSAAQLRTASVTYCRTSDQVTFRLEIFLKDKRTLSETWDLAPGS
jgi:hypothetical protein